MAKVYANLSMSLDGYVTGPSDDFEHPLGIRGELLHEWMDAEPEIVDEIMANYGAVVLGRNMFDLGDAPWGDEPPWRCPVYVVTHRKHAPIERQGGTAYYFVTGGIDEALARAREATENKDIWVGGGANLIQQFLKMGLLDELQIQLVPVFMGAGKQLFGDADLANVKLERVRVVDSPSVTHLKFRILRE